jgi:hypothetical protein
VKARNCKFEEAQWRARGLSADENEYNSVCIARATLLQSKKIHVETLSMNADPGVASNARACARSAFDSRKSLSRLTSQSLRDLPA